MEKILLAILLAVSSSAYAILDVGGMVGVRKNTFSYQETDNDAFGYELMPSAHISPLPLVPFAVGVVALMQNASYKDDKVDKTGSVNGLLIGMDVMAWVPIPLYSPYVRASYFFSGSHQAEVSGIEYSGKFKSSGYHIGVGLSSSLMPFINLLFEVNYGKQTLEPDSIKVAGQDITSLAKDAELTGFAVLGGLEVDL